MLSKKVRARLFVMVPLLILASIVIFVVLKSLEENWINNNFVMDKKVVKQLLGKNREN